jgi:phosphoribosylaminoimidazole-succinocarboxamide synthase
MITKDALAPYLKGRLWDATLPELPGHYRGKVRDNYDLADGRRLIVASDRLSAFDRILTAIPLKGQALTQLSRFWFEATADVCPNHVLGWPDPNVVLCRRLKMLPVEIVVRDYLTGTTSTSLWTQYKAGGRLLYGHVLDEGLRENQKLPLTLITPTTKADAAGHDEPLTADDILAEGLLTEADWTRVCELALALFERGRALAAERGLILVDTKYEFGWDGDGQIILADEIHTPDSSRYWRIGSYPERFAAGQPPERLDKDMVRTWVTARCDPYRDQIPDIPDEVVLDTAVVYASACEVLTGRPLDPPSPDEPVLERIRRNLRSFYTN